MNLLADILSRNTLLPRGESLLSLLFQAVVARSVAHFQTSSFFGALLELVITVLSFFSDGVILIAVTIWSLLNDKQKSLILC